MDYRLPDGQVITLGRERFRAPEIMFTPSIFGYKSQVIHAMATDSLQKVGPMYRPLVLSRVLVCGGTSKLPRAHPGWAPRLQPRQQQGQGARCPPQEDLSLGWGLHPDLPKGIPISLAEERGLSGEGRLLGPLQILLKAEHKWGDSPRSWQEWALLTSSQLKPSKLFVSATIVFIKNITALS